MSRPHGGARAKRLPRDVVAGSPLLSACLIVKDEELLLASCLESLRDLADEIVVYDTGSTDRTVEIAGAAGAVVVRGYWDDDFARARNAALDHCTGQWVLHIDADETAVADGPALRSLLAEPAAPDALTVPIDNVTPDGRVHVRHRADRLFRRARGRWAGRLHEQVEASPGQVRLRTGSCELLVVRHVGYQTSIQQSRDKAARNVRLAELDLLEADGPARAHRLLNLGRSLGMAGRLEEAAARYDEAVDVASAAGAAAVVRRALRARIQLLLDQGHAEEGLRLVSRLRGLGSPPAVPDYFEALARTMLGGRDGTVAVALSNEELVDEDGRTVSVAEMHVKFAAALLESDRAHEAADLLLAAARDGHPVDGLWTLLADLSVALGRELADVAAAVRDEDLRPVLAQLVAAPTPPSDALAAALWQRFPGDARLHAFASEFAPVLPLARTVAWSARLRAVGQAERCPLVARATDPAVSPLERLCAACLAHSAFADHRARHLLHLVGAALPASDLAQSLLAVDELAPELVVAFLEAASSAGPRSCLALAQALDDVGARAEALVVFDRGFSSSASDPAVSADAQAWLDRIGAQRPAVTLS